jgi:NADH:ubiquinone oxidoreductase subunit F (NADH-binding)
VIILVMMQVSKKIPFDDPMVLNGVRALYVVSNLLIAGIYFYVKMQIDKKKGTFTTSTSTSHPLAPQHPTST